jgi:hypothetical protein
MKGNRNACAALIPHSSGKDNNLGAIEMHSNSTMASRHLVSQGSAMAGSQSQSMMQSQDYHGSSAMASSFMGAFVQQTVPAGSTDVAETSSNELSLGRVRDGYVIWLTVQLNQVDLQKSLGLMESAILQNNYLRKLLSYHGVSDVPPVATEYDLTSTDEERERNHL